MKPLYMETTKIDARRTASEIAELLGAAGAHQVIQEFKDHKVESLFFTLKLGAQEVPFRMPIRTAAIDRRLMQRRLYVRNAQLRADQAERIAWRLALRWVQAQLAFAETEMIEVAEAFIGFAQVNRKQTLFQHVIDTGKLLMAPEGRNEHDQSEA